MKEKTISVCVDGKPVAQCRPRFRRCGRFVKCYNPQKDDKDKFKLEVQKQLSKEDHDFLKSLIAIGTDYYVSLSCTFYVPIQKSGSKKIKEKKLNNEIKPNIRPDIDNYLKFILDSMHDVFYVDDGCVTEISQMSKQYSDNPRTEIAITIQYPEDVDL